ncbi:MAG: hypothetical protein QM695_12370 [Micropruina sp.]
MQFFTTPQMNQFRSFIAARDSLIVKQVDDGQGFILRRGVAAELPDELGSAGRLYSAGGNNIWVIPEESTHGQRQISLFGVQAGGATLKLREILPDSFGIPFSDNYGSLLSCSEGGTCVVTSATSTRKLRGWRPQWELLGVGPASFLVKSCAHCGVTMHNRGATQASLATARGLRAINRLIAVYDDSADGLVSPSGKYIALSVAMKDPQRNLRLALIDLTTGKTSLIPGSLTRVDANGQFAWLDGGTLLAVADQKLCVVQRANR